MLRPALAALVGAALAACGAGHYESYRAAHPGWEPVLPHAPGGVEELVAALHAPDRLPQARVKLVGFTLLEIGGGTRWRSIDLDDLRAADPQSRGDYALIARRSCQASKGGEKIAVARIDTWLVRAGRVAAYDHSEFRGECDVEAKFLAARGDDVPVELALASHVRKEYGPRPLGVIDLYRRGIAYVEAGRFAEAEAVLRLGERGFEAAERAAARSGAPKPDAKAREERFEQIRLRERLHRALGLEPPAS